MALRNVLILRSIRRMRLEGRKAVVQAAHTSFKSVKQAS